MASSDDEGATAVEYALMAGLIAGVIAFAAGLLGQSLVTLFQDFVLEMGW